jgi:hypothetical protein
MSLQKAFERASDATFCLCALRASASAAYRVGCLDVTVFLLSDMTAAMEKSKRLLTFAAELLCSGV